MKLVYIYAIFDNKSSEFVDMIFAENDTVALRMFRKYLIALQLEDYAADFDLRRTCAVDMLTMTFYCDGVDEYPDEVLLPQVICTGDDYLRYFKHVQEHSIAARDKKN